MNFGPSPLLVNTTGVEVGDTVKVNFEGIDCLAISQAYDPKFMTSSRPYAYDVCVGSGEPK